MESAIWRLGTGGGKENMIYTVKRIDEADYGCEERAVIFDMYETLITLYRAPLYFGSQIAADAGIPEDQFLGPWRQAEGDRTTGKITLEELIEKILREYNRYSEEMLHYIVAKRIQSREEAFAHLDPGILPLLNALKDRGIRIGLISNCYSEEAAVIRKSILYPYFDGVCMSYEEGVQKPDPEIFRRCLDRLQVSPWECLYVGDGGSHELEAAKKAGMQAVQAVWYLKENPQPFERKRGFAQAKTPAEILNWI